MSGNAVAFRAHNFRQTMAAKKTYITKTAKDNMRRVNPNGFNPYGVLMFARKTATKSPKAPVVVIIRIGNYTYQDFQTWNLPPKYYRWNAELNCVEIAKHRYLAKGEKMPKDVADKDAWYYPPENEMQFVPVPPGAMIEYSDFNGKVDADSEDGVIRLMDLYPKIKNPEQLAKYPDDPDYQWNIGSINLRVGKFDPLVSPSVMCSLPAAFFHLNRPNSTEEFQRIVTLNLVDQFDDSIERQIQNKTFSFASLIFSGDDDNWAFESKEAIEQKKPFVPLPADAAANAKKRTTKCMKLMGLVEQKPNADSPLVESISIKLTVWENVIEAVYKSRDVTQWFRCWRYPAYLFAPMFVVGTVGRERTETSGWNQNVEEDAGELIALDDAPGEEDDNLKASAPPQVANVDTPAAANAEEDDFASLVNNKEEELKNAAKETIEQQKIGFFLDISVQKALVDTYDAMRRYLVPVTPAWVKSTITKPDGKKEVKNYIATTNGKYGNIDFKKPSSLESVINVSENFSPDNVKAMDELIAKGHGEYRVVVNTTTYVNESLAPAFIRTIRTLSPEEGALLLDGKPIPGKVVNWVKPENAAYVLYFLYHPARKEALRAEAMTKAKDLLAQFIRPERITLVKPAPSQGRDVVDIMNQQAAGAADGAASVGDVLSNLGAAVAQDAAAANATVQTVTPGDEAAVAPTPMTVDSTPAPVPAAAAATASPSAPKGKEKRLADEDKGAGSASDAEGEKRRKKHRDSDEKKEKKSSRHK